MHHYSPSSGCSHTQFLHKHVLLTSNQMLYTHLLHQDALPTHPLIDVLYTPTSRCHHYPYQDDSYTPHQEMCHHSALIKMLPYTPPTSRCTTISIRRCSPYTLSHQDVPPHHPSIDAPYTLLHQDALPLTPIRMLPYTPH
jgi:hypothetical protein